MNTRSAVVVAVALVALGAMIAVNWTAPGEPSTTIDVVIPPGKNPAAVPIDVTAARVVEIDAAGTLIVRRDSVVRRFPRPRAYQAIDGARRAVDVRFDITPAGHVQFAFGDYDHSRPLHLTHPVDRETDDEHP